MRMETIQFVAFSMLCAICSCIGGCFVSEEVRTYATDADVPKEIFRGLKIPVSKKVVVSSRTTRDSFTVNVRMSTSQREANAFLNDRRENLRDGAMSNLVRFESVAGIDFPTAVLSGQNSLCIEKNDSILGRNHLEQWYFDESKGCLYGCVSDVR
jgi:hypothetical protein